MEISRRDLELAISTNPGDIAVYILRGTALKTLYASANLPAMSGMSCAEYTAVTRDDAAKIVLADDRPKVTEHIREMLSGGKDANFTCRTANGTGGFIPLRVKCRAIGTMGGSPVILALLAAAPEERGEANVCRRLEEDNYRRLYRQLLDVNPTAIGTMRLNLTQNWCGDGQITPPSLRNVARTGTAEGFFRTICSLIPDDKLREAFREKYTIDKLAGYYRDGRTQFTAEFPLSLPGGEELWVEGCLNTVKNPGNGDLEAIAYMIDVTHRHKNEEIARSLTEENCEMICLIDPKRGTIECMSSNKDGDYPRLNVKLGYADSLRYTADNCVLAEDREGFLRRADIGYVAKALEKGKYSTFSYQCRENGAVRRKQLQFSWLGDRRREILSVRTDITEVYRQEQEQLRRMSQALRTAEAANTAKSEFLSRISHDIRTPMNVISGMTGFALEDMDDREKLREDLRKIQSANQFLLSLINDILDISKIDSGKIELHPEPYPYEDYISNIRSMFEPLCRKKSIAFSVESRLCGGVIMADRIRLNQISLNLLSNAVKYTPEGGAVSCITRSRRTPGGRIGLDIEVRDTGIGMSEDFQKRMFDEFTQENSETGKNLGESGTGLGLAIVRRIVDLMGGEISVKSAPGRGTDITVSLEFPEAAPGAPAKIPRAADRQSGGAPRAAGGKVLVAEDYPMNAEIAVRLLESFGYRTQTVENGAAAAAAFSASAPGEFAAILMDIQMPVMNGYEASRFIRDMMRPDAASVPIIAMTADAYAEDVERCLAAGMNAHAAKPLDPEKLRATLEGLIKN
jgi:signal transduction histidine kinase/DNA-binding NarL/FixJ family response regulator